MNEADDVIDILLDRREARVTAFLRQADIFLERIFHVEGEDIHTMHHHLARQPMAEIEDVIEQLRLRFRAVCRRVPHRWR